MALLLFRFAEAGWQIFNGVTDRVIASHEAEDLVEEAAEAAANEPLTVTAADKLDQPAVKNPKGKE